MSHAKVQGDYRKHSGVRHRKLKKDVSPSSEMVGLGSDELFVSNIADVNNMELEISSEDESDEGGRTDVQRLIPSPLNSDGVVYIGGKRDSQRSEIAGADDENVWSISIQMFIPFLLAGFGMVAASLLLDVVQVLKINLPELLRKSGLEHGAYFGKNIDRINRIKWSRNSLFAWSGWYISRCFIVFTNFWIDSLICIRQDSI